MRTLLYLGDASILKDVVDRALVEKGLDGVVVVGGRDMTDVGKLGSVRLVIEFDDSAGDGNAEREWARMTHAARGRGLACVLIGSVATEVSEEPFVYANAPCGIVGQLTALLHHRWRSLVAGLPVVALTESASGGDQLRDLVVEQAMHWRRPEDFVMWLKSECRWVGGAVTAEGRLTEAGHERLTDNLLGVAS